MHRVSFVLSVSVLAFGLAAAAKPAFAGQTEPEKMSSAIQKYEWGRTKDGQRAHLYVLTNSNGMTMRVTDYGCIIVSLTAPDRNGRLADVALGYDRLEDYLAGSPYFGASIAGFERGRVYGWRCACHRPTQSGTMLGSV